MISIILKHLEWAQSGQEPGLLYGLRVFRLAALFDEFWKLENTAKNATHVKSE